MNEIPMIGCAAGCGRSVPEAEIGVKGWEFLAIQRRYRCPQCSRELAELNKREPAP